jgi:hypothetical protein
VGGGRWRKRLLKARGGGGGWKGVVGSAVGGCCGNAKTERVHSGGKERGGKGRIRQERKGEDKTG